MPGFGLAQEITGGRTSLQNEEYAEQISQEISVPTARLRPSNGSRRIIGLRAEKGRAASSGSSESVQTRVSALDRNSTW
jgi:hypothetical protein